MRKQGPERLSDLPKVAQQVSGKGQIRTLSPKVPRPPAGSSMRSSAISPEHGQSQVCTLGSRGGRVSCCRGHRQAHTHRQKPAASFSAPPDSNTPVLEQTETRLKSGKPWAATVGLHLRFWNLALRSCLLSLCDPGRLSRTELGDERLLLPGMHSFTL